MLSKICCTIQCDGGKVKNACNKIGADAWQYYSNLRTSSRTLLFFLPLLSPSNHNHTCINLNFVQISIRAKTYFHVIMSALQIYSLYFSIPTYFSISLYLSLCLLLTVSPSNPYTQMFWVMCTRQHKYHTNINIYKKNIRVNLYKICFSWFEFSGRPNEEEKKLLSLVNVFSIAYIIVKKTGINNKYGV